MKDDLDATPPRFSVITPTYNRAHTLERLFESLEAQTRRDFEWVVVDDDSTDSTRALIADLRNRASFPVVYAHQAHGHKKVAVNHGVRIARGTFGLILDSDDALTPNALDLFAAAWDNIPEAKRHEYVGIWGLCIDENDNVVGDPFPKNGFDTTTSECVYKYKIAGEKFSCDRIDILLKYPYREDVSGFVVEQVIWADISKKFKRSAHNIKVRRYFTSTDSLTSQVSTGVIFRDVEGILHSYSHLLSVDANWIWSNPILIIFYAANRLRIWIHYRRQGHNRKFPLFGWRAKLVFALFGWLGIILYFRDWVRDRKSAKPNPAMS